MHDHIFEVTDPAALVNELVLDDHCPGGAQVAVVEVLDNHHLLKCIVPHHGEALLAPALRQLAYRRELREQVEKVAAKVLRLEVAQAEFHVQREVGASLLRLLGLSSAT